MWVLDREGRGEVAVGLGLALRYTRMCYATHCEAAEWRRKVPVSACWRLLGDARLGDEARTHPGLTHFEWQFLAYLGDGWSIQMVGQRGGWPWGPGGPVFTREPAMCMLMPKTLLFIR